LYQIELGPGETKFITEAEKWVLKAVSSAPGPAMIVITDTYDSKAKTSSISLISRNSQISRLLAFSKIWRPQL
jgi:hypothetical protein